MILDAKSDDVIAAMREVVLLTENKIKQLEIKASETTPKIMEVGKYPTAYEYKLHAGYEFTTTLHNHESWFKTKAYYGEEKLLESVSSLDERKTTLLALVDKLEADSVNVEQTYANAIQNNKLIVEKVTLLMQHIGIKSSYSVRDTKSRATYPKYNTVSAGYISDLSRDVPTQVQGLKVDTKRLRQDIEQRYNSVLQQVQQKEREAAAEKAKVQKQHQIALLRAKYTPEDAESSEWTIREKILSQDKYLRLAYYLEQNRHDWNDGCDYAETGLNGFTIETTQDQEIYDSIQALIDDWDGDGRCFRDCTWNYGALYGLVENQQLLDDLEQLKGY